MAAAGQDGVHVVDPQRLGMALGTLGARSYRTRRGGRQVRVYDLRSIRTDGDPPATLS
ncbi:MAG TPA: hypothetical protein VMH78_03245 [Thermoplasmata archaeon]|nr:hypothetical protein [Thermoplasmata archaeon]